MTDAEFSAGVRRIGQIAVDLMLWGPAAFLGVCSIASIVAKTMGINDGWALVAVLALILAGWLFLRDKNRREIAGYVFKRTLAGIGFIACMLLAIVLLIHGIFSGAILAFIVSVQFPLWIIVWMIFTRSRR